MPDATLAPITRRYAPPRAATPLDPAATRLLYVVEHFPSEIHPNQIGPAAFALRSGAEVTIATQRPLGDSYPEKVDRLGLIGRTRYFSTFTRADTLRNYLPYLKPFSPDGRRAWRGLARALGAASTVRAGGAREWLRLAMRARILGERPYTFVHARYIPGAADFLFVADALDLPLLVTFGGLPPVTLAQYAPAMLERVFSRADLLVANTAYGARQLEELGCPAHKLRVLFQGVDLDDFPFAPKPFPKDGDVTMLTVARLSEEKGIRYGIETMARLRDEFPRLRYRIVGPGPDRAELEALVRRLGLEDRVTFVGVKNGAAIAEEYRNAHIFLLPSVVVRGPNGELWEEVQGVSVQEAQASGAIAITTRTGGLTEVVDDGRAGFLVPERDVDATAERVRGILQHPERWPEWQHAGREWIETHFDLDRVGERLWMLYAEAAELHRGRGRA